MLNSQLLSVGRHWKTPGHIVDVFVTDWEKIELEKTDVAELLTLAATARNLMTSSARQFLNLLDPEAEKFTFQTVDDDKDRKDSALSQLIHASDAADPELLQLNKRRAGIHVTINASDGMGRTSENITRVRAVWQEDDDGYDGPFPLEPSMVVETSPGHCHRYWLVADAWPADKQGRDDFNAVIDRMVESYGSDKGAKGINRVLRVPGFLHRKDPTRQHVVRLIPASNRRYTRGEIIAAFPPVERKANGHQQQQWKSQSGDSDIESIRDALSAIPATDRDIWLQMGMALKAELGEAGRHLWDDWSASCPDKYRDRDQNAVWKSFRGNGIGIGTLFHHAKQYGWQPRRHTSHARSSSAPPTDGADHDERPVIQIEAGALDKLATAGEQALIAAGVPFYAHADELQRPIVDEVEATKGRKAKVARFATVTPDMLRDYLSRSARWERFNERKKDFVPADPSRDVAATILSRAGEWKFPTAVGVITTPTLRPDGTILGQPGYDLATRLILLDPPRMPQIPEQPTKDHAIAAVRLLSDLLTEFPFVDEASKSVALSELITPVVRGAMTVCPLHANRAPAPGTGKSYLFDISSGIISGQPCPVISAGTDEFETEKRLGAALLRGQALICIDNLNGELRGDALCQIIERPIVEIRPLGFSRLVRIESRTTMFANGNNMVLVGDIVRRVLLCSLDSDMERPELRQFKNRPFATVLANRGHYIAAALTIVRAYLAAGCPQTLPDLASFEDWSRLVRSALVWLDHADPVDTIEAARDEDPELDERRKVMTALLDTIGPDQPYTTAQIKESAEQKTTSGDYHEISTQFAHPELREALLSVAYSGGTISPKKLGRWLGRNRGRIVNGCKLTSRPDSHTKLPVWVLQRSGG